MTRSKHSWTILSRISLLCLLLFCAPSYAEFRHINEWTDKEKAVFFTYSAITYIDVQQTRWALDHPCQCYYEANPIFGKDPHKDKLYLISALSTAAVYSAIGYEAPNAALKPLWILNAVRFGVVVHNNSVGVSWEVAF